MRTWKLLTLTSLLVSGLALLGCGGEEPGEAGSAAIGVSTQALSAADVSSVRITVSGANISPAIVQNLNATGGQWKGVVNHIPVGTGRTFQADAANSSGTIIYSGSITNVTITKGSPVTVIILLQQVTAPTPFTNSSPYITGMTASETQAGFADVVSLAVSASDPDTTDTLSYSWSQGSCAGTFTNDTTASPTWTAPSTAGTCTLTVTVSDGNGAQTGMDIVIAVQEYYGDGAAQISVSFNSWPVVSALTADPGHVAASGSVAVAVTASDPDGHALTYAWDDGACAGSFASATSASTTYTAAAAWGNCTLTVTVTDVATGYTTGSVLVKVGNLGTTNVAPEIDESYQTSLGVDYSGAATLKVVADDPDSTTAPTVTWATTAGTLGTATDTTASGVVTSEVVLTAPSSCNDITVTASVSDGTNTTSVPFYFVCNFANAVSAAGNVEVLDLIRDGNYVLIAGHFSGTATIGGTSLTSAGSSDLFVAKMNNAGTLVWAVQAGGTDQDRALDIVADASGNVYVAGYVTGTAPTFAGLTVTGADSSRHAMVAKLSSAGVWQWVALGGGSGLDEAAGLALDSTGSLGVTGYFNGTATFGSTSLTSAGDSDILLAKVSSTGTWSWATGTGYSFIDLGLAIAADSSGNFYVGGQFTRTVTFGSTTLTALDAPAQYYQDGFVAKASGSGTWQWATRMGGTDYRDQINSVVVPTSTEVLVAGTYRPTSTQATFDTVSLDATAVSYGRGVVASLNASTGAVTWAASLGGNGEAQATALTASTSTRIDVVGSFTGGALFGSSTLTSAGSTDIFLAHLVRSTGVVESATRAGGTGADVPTSLWRSVSAYGTNVFYVGGYFSGTASFGDTSLTSGGGRDGFCWKVGLP